MFRYLDVLGPVFLGLVASVPCRENGERVRGLWAAFGEIGPVGTCSHSLSVPSESCVESAFTGLNDNQLKLSVTIKTDEAD